MARDKGPVALTPILEALGRTGFLRADDGAKSAVPGSFVHITGPKAVSRIPSCINGPKEADSAVLSP